MHEQLRNLDGRSCLHPSNRGNEAARQHETHLSHANKEFLAAEVACVLTPRDTRGQKPTTFQQIGYISAVHCMLVTLAQTLHAYSVEIRCYVGFTARKINKFLLTSVEYLTVQALCLTYISLDPVGTVEMQLNCRQKQSTLSFSFKMLCFSFECKHLGNAHVHLFSSTVPLRLTNPAPILFWASFSPLPVNPRCQGSSPTLS